MVLTIQWIKKNKSSMKLSEECFKKVKKDCFKFIKSQETSTEKFGNKEGMIKNFLIPICFWIAKKADNKKPYFVGLAGGTRNRQNNYKLNNKDNIRKVF